MKKNLILFVVFVVVGIAAWLVYRKNHTSTIADQPLSAFAIEDTASINKVVIVDMNGQRATLERKSGDKLWTLNNKYLARKDATDLLLKTFSQIRVRGNVADKMRDNAMKLLSTSGKKVEIYTGGDEPAKIYYVGTSTEDHTGTIMLLEIPGIGRSQEPYITHMEGFTGFLTTRFFTCENEWRYTGIFEYPDLEFKRVQMINHNNPNYSFEVQFNGGNDIKLLGGYLPSSGEFSITQPSFDTLAVKDFLLLFKKAHVESFNTLLRPEAADSMRAIPPAFTIRVFENSGMDNKIDLYLKRSPTINYDENGNPVPWDVDYFYARTMSDEFAMAQMYTFQPMVKPIEFYLSKN